MWLYFVYYIMCFYWLYLFLVLMRNWEEGGVYFVCFIMGI